MICPNLEEIRGIHYRNLLAVAWANKMDLVSHLVYCKSESYHERSQTQEPVSVPEKLSTLAIRCYHYEREEDSEVEFWRVREMLEASSDTLNCLVIRSPLGGGSRADNWPILSNLKKLVITAKKCFPQQVSSIFPTLHHVILDAAVTDRNNLRSYFWTDVMSTVEVLELHCHVTQEGIDLLASIFPNVSSVLVHCCRHDDKSKTQSKFSQKMWDIWGLKAFAKLKNLKIIDLPVALMSTEEFSLDSFITGFPQFVVANVRAKPELLKTSYVEELLEGGCVTELQGLQELSISFDLDGLKPTAFRRELFVSDLMLKAGLNLMPSLRATTFYYDFAHKNAGVMEKLLSPVSGLIDCQYFDGVSPSEA